MLMVKIVIYSYALSVGDEISVREKSTSLLVINDSISNEDHIKMDWLEFNSQKNRVL